MLVGKPSLVARCKSQLNSLDVDNVNLEFSSKAKNLGVLFDESLLFKEHIATIFRSSFLYLKNLKTIRSHFNRKNFEVIVHAFVTSRLDYCNSLFTGLPSSTLRPLTLLQNFAARLILRKSKFSSATPLLRELHWLPITYRIQFKVLLLTYKTLQSDGPSYLSSLLNPLPIVRSLRSNSGALLHVPRSRSVRFGDCSFSVFAPKLWNSLPLNIRTANSVTSFKSLLKTYLFRRAFELGGI